MHLVIVKMKRHVLAEISQAGKEDFFKDFMD